MVHHPITELNLLMTGIDLLDGGTSTDVVSQRSEVGQRILCDKEDIGKYDMWYGVVCKPVMSSCMSAGCSLAGGRDMVPCLAITANRQNNGRNKKNRTVKSCHIF